MAVFNLPEDKVRVVQTETGGAFGGKEDYPSILCVSCCAVGDEERPCGQDGLRPHGGSGRDDQAASLARAPSHRARCRTANCSRWISNWRPMAALTRRFLLPFSRGQHCTLLDPTCVLTCACARRAWATNTVPYGAFRGFGAPQAIFAIERHMDEIAAAIGMDPIELRRRNFLHDGDTTATEQVMREPVILDRLLDRALNESDYYAQARTICEGKSEQSCKARHGHCGFLSRLGFYWVGRALSEFAWRARCMSTAKCACWYQALNSARAPTQC